MHRLTASKTRQAVLLAFSSVVGLFLWQCLTVHYNYGGNWTALFCIRPDATPSYLASEHLYIFKKGGGYDGMIYHVIAHDPWMRRGSAEVIAEPAFRYQRILVPLLAWLLAFGQDQWIHAAYFTVILGFAFLGVYWLSQFASRIGRSPWWGLAFLLTPAAITSIDRMTVDIALAAFTAGFALYAGKSPGWKILAILTGAALSRETGLLLVAGYAVYLFTRRFIHESLMVSATAIPAVAWFLFLAKYAPKRPSSLSLFVARVPLAPYFHQLTHLKRYRAYGTTVARYTARSLDEVALIGAALVLSYAVYLLIRRRWDYCSAVIFAFALGASFIGPHGVWWDVYSYGRVLTPLLLLTAMVQMGISPVAAFLPIVLIDLRVGLYFVSQIHGIVRGLTGL